MAVLDDRPRWPRADEAFSRYDHEHFQSSNSSISLQA